MTVNPPVVWMFPPDITANSGSAYDSQFPEPDRKEDDPVAPLYCVIKSQCKQQGEHQQAEEDQTFAEEKKFNAVYIYIYI